MDGISIPIGPVKELQIECNKPLHTVRAHVQRHPVQHHAHDLADSNIEATVRVSLQPTRPFLPGCLIKSMQRRTCPCFILVCFFDFLRR